MTLYQTLLCAGGLIVGLAGSALFSGIETGVYSLNRVRLHVFAHAQRAGAATLEALLRRPNRLLAALLVGNNIVNYMVSTSIGTLLDGAGYRGWSQVAINALLLMPVLLVFGEIIPKDMFRAHADRLTYRFARFLSIWQLLLTVTGIVPLIDRISRAFEPGDDQELPMHMLHPRRLVTALIREGVGLGVISPYQSDMVDRVLELSHLPVREVMIPWAKAVATRADAPPEAVWTLADRTAHERVPLLDSAGRPIGRIEIERVLSYEPDKCPPLTQLAEPLAQLDPDMSCRAALLHLQQQRLTMAVVLEKDRPIGLVTTKELVEPIVGELEVW